MEAGGLGGDPEVREQVASAAGIFRGDQVDLLQDSEGAQRDVFQVADGRGDQEERSGHNGRLGTYCTIGSFVAHVFL
jgi:hypothetical protein